MQLVRIDLLDGTSHFAYGQRVMTDPEYTAVEDRRDGDWTAELTDLTAAVAGVYQGIRVHDEPPTWGPVTAMRAFGVRNDADSEAAHAASPKEPRARAELFGLR